MVGIILLGFGFFMVGYFLGKRKVIQDMCVQLEQESLADKIYTSLCTLPDAGTAVAGQEKEELEAVENNMDKDALLTEQAVDVVNTGVHEEEPVVQQEAMLPTVHKKYYAQLVGFGTLQAAERCAKRLTQHAMPVVVKHRHSKTAKGKKIQWYQVVTQEFSDQKELEKVVQIIKEKERLKDVRIVSC